jgi:hypothetical protein
MFAPRLKLPLNEGHPMFSNELTHIADRQIWLPGVQFVCVTHMLPLQTCTAVFVLLHCVPVVHCTQLPAAQMGVGAAHGV